MDSRSRWLVGSSSSRRFRSAEERLREQHAHFLAALQFAHFALDAGLGNVQAVEQNGGVAFGGVAVVLGDDAFQFAEPHAVFIGHVGLGVDLARARPARPTADGCP